MSDYNKTKTLAQLRKDYHRLALLIYSQPIRPDGTVSDIETALRREIAAVRAEGESRSASFFRKKNYTSGPR